MFRNYILREEQNRGGRHAGRQACPRFFYKGLSAALQLVKRPSDCLSAALRLVNH